MSYYPYLATAYEHVHTGIEKEIPQTQRFYKFDLNDMGFIASVD